MNKIWFTFCSLFLLACGTATKHDDKTAGPVKDYLLQDNYMSNALAANHEKIKNTKGNIQLFTTYINNLSDSLTTNLYALDYLANCNLSVDAEKDTAYALFDRHFYKTLSKLTDSVDTKYKFLFDLVAKDSNTAELTCFKKNLEACGVGIFSGEGNFYVDVLPDYYYDNFKNRVSSEVRDYLAIRRDEMKQGYAVDGGLVIGFDTLYLRIKKWEAFLAKYPNTRYRKEVVSNYNMYVGTLMIGMDNTRVFDIDGDTLLPEIKSLYQKIVADDPASPTTKLFTLYYNYLAKHNFIQTDSTVAFAIANNTPAILAVQPPTK